MIDEPSAVIDGEGTVGEPEGRLDGIPISGEAKFLINASKWAYQGIIRRKNFSLYMIDTSGAGFTEQFPYKARPNSVSLPSVLDNHAEISPTLA